MPGEVYVTIDWSFYLKPIPYEFFFFFFKCNFVHISDFAYNFRINVFLWTLFVVLMSQAGRDGPVPMEACHSLSVLFSS